MKEIKDILPDDVSLEKEAPLLHSISKENPFSVPANYFDGLPAEIMEKSREKVNDNAGLAILQNFRLFILSYKWRLLSVTGCAVVICFMLVHNRTQPTSYMAMAQNIPDSLIVEHLDKNITDVSMVTLEDISADSSFGLTGKSVSTPAKTVSDSASTDQDIIAYLINNNVSVSDIENEP